MNTEKTNPNVFSFKKWLLTYFEKHPKTHLFVNSHNEYFLRKWMPSLSDTLQREHDASIRHNQLKTIQAENNAKYAEPLQLSVGGESEGEVTV